MDASTLYVALSENQNKTWQEHGCIRKHWFHGSIPLKNTYLAATEAYQEVNATSEKPPFMAVVTISSGCYMALSHADWLQHFPRHDGYRLGLDIDAKLLKHCTCAVERADGVGGDMTGQCQMPTWKHPGGDVTGADLQRKLTHLMALEQPTDLSSDNIAGWLHVTLLCCCIELEMRRWSQCCS